MKDRRGKQITEQVIRNEGRANAEWLEKNKLTMNSPPEDWVEALLKDKRKPTDPRNVVTLAEWTTYTNTKAMLCNAGQKGGITLSSYHSLPKKSKATLPCMFSMG